jgi:hypothetical protein
LYGRDADRILIPPGNEDDFVSMSENGEQQRDAEEAEHGVAGVKAQRTLIFSQMIRF